MEAVKSRGLNQKDRVLLQKVSGKSGMDRGGQKDRFRSRQLAIWLIAYCQRMEKLTVIFSGSLMRILAENGNSVLERGVKERPADRVQLARATSAALLLQCAEFLFRIEGRRLGVHAEPDNRDNEKKCYLKETPDTARYVTPARCHKRDFIKYSK